MEKNDPNIYVVSENYATGEGLTVSILITRATPLLEDYLEPSYIDDQGKFHFNSKTKNTANERALKEFNSKFGDFYSIGAEILDRYEFFHRYQKYVPDFLYKTLDPDQSFPPAGFFWYSQIYVNYS